MAEHKDEGLMDKILSLVSPPQPSSSQKGRGVGKKSKAGHTSATALANHISTISTFTTTASSSSSSSSSSSASVITSLRHSGMQNHSYCDACGDGGSLLCCDTCPTSFHFNCCDPPVDPKKIPSGDWLCRRCRAENVGGSVPDLFQPLVGLAVSSNPRVFNLPYELQRRDILPGSSRKELKQARLYFYNNERETEVKELRRFCYMCNNGPSVGRMVSCDFCPLIFHLDCLHPPLTIPPTSVWMCPIHPNAKIPGFDHPRLSERLKALEKGQADISYHSIKADFIKQIRKIPPHKRTTRHHNRRVTEVPAAIKSLYASPLPDVSCILPVSDSLLTPVEDVERWRVEEEAHRKQLTAHRQLTITHNQDEWTRRVVQCQLQALQDNKQNASHSDRSEREVSPYSDSSVLVAAQQLLELSAVRGAVKMEPKQEVRLNGLIRPLPSLLNKDELLSVNGGSCDDVSGDVSENSSGNGRRAGRFGDTGSGEECVGSLHKSEMLSSAKENALDSVASEHCIEVPPDPPDRKGCSPALSSPTNHMEQMEEEKGREEGVELVERQEEPMEVQTETQPHPLENPFVPDLSQLDPKLVQLLALQRILHLLTHQSVPGEAANNDSNATSNVSATTTGGGHNHTLQARPDHIITELDASGLSEREKLILDALRQHVAALSPLPTPPPSLLPPSKASLLSASGILCPLSGTSFVAPLHKQVISIGLGPEVDVNLVEFGHCNFVSPRQACIFYDTATRDYELINYSEHGTLVDGVLYSCDFSDKSHDSDYPSSNSYFDNETNSPLHMSVITAQAVSKLQAARRLLENKQEAKRAVEGAIRLSVPLKDDLSLAEEMSKCEGLMTRTGLKRVTGESVGSSLLAVTGGGGGGDSGLGGSSVVFSIPLSKTTDVGGGSHPKRTLPYKSRGVGRGGVRVEVLQRNNEDLEKKLNKISNKSQCHLQSRTVIESQVPESQSSSHRVLCDCRRSLTSVCTNRKGWEGTASLSHGSRLRFGCLQFILSLTGQPGHSELIKAVSDVRI